MLVLYLDTKPGRFKPVTDSPISDSWSLTEKKLVVIKDLSGTRHVIQVKDIVSRKKSEKSLMPEASALGLSDQELADVVGFLNNLK